MRQIKTNNINNKNDDSEATHSAGNKEGKTVKKSALLRWYILPGAQSITLCSLVGVSVEKVHDSRNRQRP